ncbi:MAG: glycosyltransferase family 39 protein [Polyangiaceae bacterium]
MSSDPPEKQPDSSPEAKARPSTTASIPPPPSLPILAQTARSEARFGWVPLTLAIAVPVLLFFVLPPLSKSGLWDPYELNVADLARRLAVNLFHDSSAALAGTDNSLPHLNDLGRPELPFTSMALGFKVFGLHVWAGRFPLAVWGLVGVIALYGAVARLIDKRAGLYTALALSTMPLYFVQARTMLGDIVTMSAISLTFSGFAVAVFDTGRPKATLVRLGWLVVGLVGVVSGYMSRGALIGVAAPLGGIGLAWALAALNGRRARDPLGDAIGGLALGVGGAAAFVAFNALGDATPKTLSLPIGAMLKTPAKYPTFDFMIGNIGHALAPWSAFAPFALGRLFLPPRGEGREALGLDAFRRESIFRTAILLTGATIYAAQAFLASRTDPIAFAGPAIIAAACGIAIRDFDRGAHASVAVGVGTFVFLEVLHHDFHEISEKAFQAFAVAGGTFPESFKDKSLMLWSVALYGFGAVAFLSWVERDSERKPFDPKVYLKVIDSLRDAWDGILMLIYFATIAGASLAGLVVWAGARMQAPWLHRMSLPVRDFILNAWWIVALAPPLAVFGVMFACDVWLWAFGRASQLSKESFTRGFEPFEELFERMGGEKTVAVAAPKSAALDTKSEDKKLESKPALKPEEAKGRSLFAVLLFSISMLSYVLSGGRWLVFSVSKDLYNPEHGVTEEGRELLVSLLVLVPLMVLAIPGAALVELLSHHIRPAISIALAIPSGISAFLLIGFLGELLEGRRAAGLALFGATCAAVLSVAYYPALANQLSPKEVFESYEKVHKAGEPLALFGVGGRTAAYYAGGEPMIINESGQAYRWLMDGTGNGHRRFLAMRADELPKLNQLYRERAEPRQNIPVLDARSSQIMLLASSLMPGEKNENPIDKMVLPSEPHPQHPMDVNMDDKLQILGYDMTDDKDKRVDGIAPGRKYKMHTYYRVLQPITTEWEAFIHIDGFHRRHNGDHKVMEGKYPFGLWLPGDILEDEYEYTLEPNFTPGAYTLYFGLFVGESRLKVKSGPSDGDNRINGGPIRVQ